MKPGEEFREAFLEAAMDFCVSNVIEALALMLLADERTSAGNHDFTPDIVGMTMLSRRT